MKAGARIWPLLISSACLTIPFHTTGQTPDQVAAQLQVPSEEEHEEMIRQYSVPKIPGLDFISADPDDISRPSSIKELATALYNGIDEDGNVKQGLALEVKPAELLSQWFNVRINPSEYKKTWKYAYYNTQISGGSVATSGDSSSTDIGWGIRITVHNNSNPMKSKKFLNSLEQAMLKTLAPATPDDATKTDADKITEMKEAKKKLVEEFEDEYWNAGWFTISYSGGYRLKDQRIEGRTALGYQILFAGGVKLGGWGQLGLKGKWADIFPQQGDTRMRSFEAGGKLLAGNKSRNLFSEISLNMLQNENDFNEIPTVDPDELVAWAAGVEFRILDGLWARLGLGEQADRFVGSDGVQVLSGLRMGLAQKSGIDR